MFKTIIRRQISSGYSWTLTTRLGHMLNQAEALFGKRDMTYTILGIEFCDVPQPPIWYPGDCKHVSICLTLDCLNDLNEGIYELAHEVVHCLSPTGDSSPSNVLEEGMATHFAIEYALKHGFGDYSQVSDPRYREANDLYRQLITIDPDAVQKLRDYNMQPTISHISSSDLIFINNDIPIALAESLTRVF